MTQRIDELDRISTGVLETLGTQGVQAESLAQWKDRVSDLQFSLQKQTDELESVDVAAAITELAQHQNLYQMTLSLITRMNSLSLRNSCDETTSAIACHDSNQINEPSLSCVRMTAVISLRATSAFAFVISLRNSISSINAFRTRS